MGFTISKKIYHSNLASIFYDESSLNSKLKIVVKKKDYSLAVHRNKIKRWIREIFHCSNLSGGYVVVVRFGFLEMGYRNIFNEFNPVLEEFAGNKKA